MSATPGKTAELPNAREFHHLEAHEAVLMLGTDRQTGLSEDAAHARLDQFGPNRLPRPARPGAIARFAAQLRHPLVVILLIAGGVMVGLGEPVDAGVIFGVVLLAAMIGYVQESRAERSLEALVLMTRTRATIVRDGRRRTVDSEHVVPGDLVLLEPGDRVPADLRLIEVNGLQADESALTGESLPVAKHDDAVAPHTLMADRRNLAYAATLVTAGRAAGVAVNTGADTELGRIHRLVAEATDVETPLTRRIARFSKVIAVVVLALAAVTFAIGLARGETASDMFLAAVALAVGAIPEGLPAAVTITLAIGVSRMARRNAIVRKLPAVETLGSTTIICSDKTGTLTRNRMSVVEIDAAGRRYVVETPDEADGATIRPAGHEAPAARQVALDECIRAGALCNDARIRMRDERPEMIGDPTEGALLISARARGLDPAALRARQPRLDALPFEPEHGYMATLHREPAGDGSVVYVKGAVERVIERCEWVLDADGREMPIDRQAQLRSASDLAARGLRVLAFARRRRPDGVLELERRDAEEGLTLLGLQAMLDPPRPEAIRAVERCRSAGIAVKMITGDHPETARTIASRFGIGAHAAGGAGVLTGADLAAMDQAQLRESAAETDVFARVTPEQKLRLVRALQARGEVVAMTGDGVNDAAALRQADIGVAMGRSGTEVAKEASDIVLTDDNFASIEAAVEEGRRVFDNLTKFIVWTLPTNMGEGLLLLAAIAAGTTLPILPVQILWINMTTAVGLGLMLAFEPMESGVMERQPRDPHRPLLTGELVGRIVLVSVLLLAGSFLLFHLEQDAGASVAEARTAAINVFVAGEMLYLLNCRSLDRSILSVGIFTNPWVTAGLGVTALLQLLLTYAPPMQDLFHTAALDVEAWLRILAVGVLVSVTVGAEKRIRRQWRARSRASSPSPSA